MYHTHICIVVRCVLICSLGAQCNIWLYTRLCVRHALLLAPSVVVLSNYDVSYSSHFGEHMSGVALIALPFQKKRQWFCDKSNVYS